MLNVCLQKNIIVLICVCVQVLGIMAYICTCYTVDGYYVWACVQLAHRFYFYQESRLICIRKYIIECFSSTLFISTSCKNILYIKKGLDIDVRNYTIIQVQLEQYNIHTVCRSRAKCLGYRLITVTYLVPINVGVYG